MSDLTGIVSVLADAGLLEQAPPSYPPISGVCDDSRAVESGSLFCAVEGTATDGHRFLPDAVARGAVAAIVGRPFEGDVPCIVCSDSRAATSLAAAHWYGYPGRDLTLIGVTGTNGKTTTVSLIRHLLNGDGRAGSVGTLGAIDGTGDTLAGHDSLTTPGAVELQEVLATLRDRGVVSVPFEASSHALDQGRLAHLDLAVGTFTNLTHEHLDYHGDIDEYLRAKAKLVGYVRDEGAVVINADDTAWRSLEPGPGQRTITFGTANADVRVTGIEHHRTHSTCHIDFSGTVVPATIPLPGHFNVSNAAGAVATAWALGMDPTTIVERLQSMPPVAGRMEQLVGDAFSIIRDYAHTPDALARAIQALRPVTAGRLIVLFGAGGDRDKAKRPVMGEIAARLADVVVVTSDNPRTEDPDAILDDIEEGMPGDGHIRITDRREAVGYAVGLLQDDDCLLLAGKGHEIYQVVGTEYLPFDERVIVDEVMARRGFE